MQLKHVIKVLALVSGAMTGADVLAGGDKVVPTFDSDNSGAGNMSQQIQDGVTGSIGPSLPVIDNILEQGIKLPDVDESTERGLEGETREESGAREKK